MMLLLAPKPFRLITYILLLHLDAFPQVMYTAALLSIVLYHQSTARLEISAQLPTVVHNRIGLTLVLTRGYSVMHFYSVRSDPGLLYLQLLVRLQYVLEIELP